MILSGVATLLIHRFKWRRDLDHHSVSRMFWVNVIPCNLLPNFSFKVDPHIFGLCPERAMVRRNLV